MTASNEVAYVDSSLLLQVLLAQPRGEEAARLWDRHPRRISSILLEAECRTALRRAERAGTLPLGLAHAERDLEVALAQVTLHFIDRRVIEQLAEVPGLGRCRTLDALHLATLLSLRERLGSSPVLLGFDRNLAEVARDLGIAARPA